MPKLFRLKRGDTRPLMVATLYRKDSSGQLTVMDLSQATQVKFIMRNAAGKVIVSALTTILAPANGGKVRYTWQPQDTATSGRFVGEFEVTFNDGGVETVSNTREFIVRIRPDLG